MSAQGKRLFNYTKLIDDVQKKSAKSQEMLSVNLECTAAHISNVKRKKSTFSLDKTLQLLNENDYCIDDYVENDNDIRKRINRDDREILQGIESDLRWSLMQLVLETVRVSHRSAEKNYSDLDHEERKKRIGEHIRQIRLEKNISVETMCKQMQIKKTTYQNIENGSNGTTMENYARIANTLQVPLSFLMSDILRNKDTLIDYQVYQLFSQVNFRERKKLEGMIDELSEVIKKYLES